MRSCVSTEISADWWVWPPAIAGASGDAGATGSLPTDRRAIRKLPLAWLKAMTPVPVSKVQTCQKSSVHTDLFSGSRAINVLKCLGPSKCWVLKYSRGQIKQEQSLRAPLALRKSTTRTATRCTCSVQSLRHHIFGHLVLSPSGCTSTTTAAPTRIHCPGKDKQLLWVNHGLHRQRPVPQYPQLTVQVVAPHPPNHDASLVPKQLHGQLIGLLHEVVHGIGVLRRGRVRVEFPRIASAQSAEGLNAEGPRQCADAAGTRCHAIFPMLGATRQLRPAVLQPVEGLGWRVCGLLQGVSLAILRDAGPTGNLLRKRGRKRTPCSQARSEAAEAGDGR
jgi:hypothetical protein